MNLKLHSLQEAFSAIKEFCEQYRIPESLCYKVNLISEELIVNLFQYSRATEYVLDLSLKGEKLMIQISYQGPEFNPTRPPEVKSSSVEEMQYGGLGLVLVNMMASHIEYSYDLNNEFNVIKVTL